MAESESLSTARSITNAESIMKACVAGEKCQYNLVPIERFRQTHLETTLKSTQYQNYVVLRHSNCNLHAGWIMCKYVMNGSCTISKGMFELDTRKGGTNRFGNHIKRHLKSNSGTITFNRNLPQKCAKEIAESVAYAVALDSRPMGFAESSHARKSKLLTSVFKAGQGVPLDVKIDPKSHIQSRKAVTMSLGKLVKQYQHEFQEKLDNRVLSIGGAISIEGVNITVQGRHYYDVKFIICNMNDQHWYLMRLGCELKPNTFTS